MMRTYIILTLTVCSLHLSKGQNDGTFRIGSGASKGSLGPGSSSIFKRRRGETTPIDSNVDQGLPINEAGTQNIPETFVNGPAIDPIPVTNDVMGNVPPLPSGPHVDLPGKHGIMNEPPIFDSGHSAGTPMGADVMIDINTGAAPVEVRGILPELSVSPIDSSMSPDLPILSEGIRVDNTAVLLGKNDPNPVNIDSVFHGSQVHNLQPNAPPAEGFVDLAPIGSPVVPSDLNTVAVPQQNFIDPIVTSLPGDNPGGIMLPPKEPLSSSDGFGIVSDGFSNPSDGFSAKPPLDTSGLIKDIHSGAIEQSLQKAHSTTGTVPARIADIMGTEHSFPMGSVHVDMPGEHGNPIDGQPVIHRENAQIPSTVQNQNFGPLMQDIQIDLSGGQPFIDTHSGGSPVGSPLGNVHIDMPGEHGNPHDGSPVVHRETPETGFVPGASDVFPGTPIGNSGIGIPGGQVNSFGGGTLLGNVHIDLPGEHGNPIDGSPVVHRENVFPAFPSSGVPVGTPSGNVHIDMPGEHGNPLHGDPVVHRDNTLPAFPTSGVPIGPSVGNVHIDMPGEHGNPVGGSPVVHREDVHPLNNINPGTPIGLGGVAIPNQHGHSNRMDVHQDHGIHIDAPGMHGNTLNEPALHLPPGATIDDARAAGIIPGSPGINPNIPVGPSPGVVPDIHIDAPGFGHPVAGHDVGSHKPGHGIHIDAPGEHGNTLNEPALHLPPGATIDDARAAGVIPGHPSDGHGHVNTGVFPGTANVPIPPKHHDTTVLVPHNPKKGPSLGDMLGIPSVKVAPAPGNLDEFGPFSPGVRITPDPDLNSYRGRGGGRRGRGRGGRWRGGRRNGRGRWRNGRGRGGRGRWNDNTHDDHAHDHSPATTTTTTTTTQAPPSNPGNGITIIRTSRPNPLGNLGNAIRSALTNGGNGGGGLLGSLVQSALGALAGQRGGGFRGFGPAPGPVVMVPGRPVMFGGGILG